ncbi:prolyl oligopeptidase family serine peptidase [Streptomyces sp. LP11]|uniref:Prolyl oligopeptidase family serine peptidase n=1 Tax=Streptomyces pyxinicus TaxID=2970331 RepID=A0ABT2B4B9_9ACTN|nr:prolyl oligopeptidase family serine peptidase [Streptomyces sp. LP11]MCS0603368.1 prolyl oligopeptidase family serine peptidase [Streptomyces sp. LP11]
MTDGHDTLGADGATRAEGAGVTTDQRPAPPPTGTPRPDASAATTTSLASPVDTDGRARARAAPARVPLPDASGPRDAVTRLIAHGCWYPSADPAGTQVAFICDRAGVPQLWAGSLDGDDVRLLDAGPDPVREVSWSPDGRWIAYTTVPGGGEHSRVLCVRPDGRDRHILAGAEPGTSAYLGCWAHDGSAVAVTVAVPSPPGPVTEGTEAPAEPDGSVARLPAGWSGRDGGAVHLGAGPLTPTRPDATTALHTGPGRARTPSELAPAAGHGDGLSAYLINPDGVAAPVLLAAEEDAATLRVCDLSHDGALALLRRGPRGRREAVVLRTADLAPTCVFRVADGDPWIGRFSPQADTLWLRSDADREFAALVAVRLDPDGRPRGSSVVAERAGSDLELLAGDPGGRGAVLAWNAGGAGEVEIVDTLAPGGTGPLPVRPVALPHEVVTRIVDTGDGHPVLALSGSQRRPGVWWLREGEHPARTPWSSRDEDAVPPGRPPVRPVPLRPTARDGLRLHGWYYRAPGRGPGEPAPCVIHLHGGPEEQERPVLNPLYHEILGRGIDIFAPDVRGSSGHGRSFVDADLGGGRFAALDDVADCAAHAVLAGPADPSRLAVMGRSYGGYLTFASLVRHPDLFRTGVAVCGMSDFATFFEGTEPWIAQSAAHKYGHPERDRDLLRSLSPMTYVDALRVPVLAVHGEHDTNVPPGESEQFVRAARERGLTAQLLTLRDEGHDFLRAANRRLFRRAAADWLQRHLGG